jgi:Alpha/beta hydrolase of unknown function (DUF900)
MRGWTIVPLALGLLGSALPTPAGAQSARATRCQAGKVLAVGRYDMCRAKADARAVKKGVPANHARCDARFRKKWLKLEAKAKGACPTQGDLAALQLEALRHGQRATATLAASASCSPAGLPFAYSYMVTNRATPFATTRDDILPAAPGTLTFFTAPGPYQATDVSTNYEEVTKDVFVMRLKSDLAAAASGGIVRLGLYIHGLGNTFDDALAENAEFGCNLARDGGYPGLLIGFSWPSYDFIDSALYYATAGPPVPSLTPQRSGSVRDNVLGSRESFAALLQTIQDDVVAGANPPVELSVITHSEGNYMLMTGTAAVTGMPEVAHCLMLAADVSAVSLQDGEQGAAVPEVCDDVTVYYSGADEELGSSNYEFFPFHRQDYPTRLGLVGPYYGFPAPAALPANVAGLDCSRVTVSPAVSSIIDVHSSYRSVPDILADQTETMLDEAHPKRTAIPGTTQGFVLAP